MQRVMVLGATGSIGASTLDVIQRHPEQFRAHTLTANRSVDAMAKLCIEHKPEFAVMSDESAADSLRLAIDGRVSTTVLSGEPAMVELAQSESVDTVMAAIVGC